MVKTSRRQCIYLAALVIVIMALGALLWVSVDDVVGIEHHAVHSEECCDTAELSANVTPVNNNNNTNNNNNNSSDCKDLKQPSNCPTNGVPAVPDCETKCTHGEARPKIENNNGKNTCSSRFNNTKLTCSNQHTWSVSKKRVLPHQMPTNSLEQEGCAASPAIKYEVISVENNPGVYSLAGGQVHLEISNPGDCDSQIVNVLISLEQQTGGANTRKVWAVSGLENAALMEACGAGMDASPPAHLCDSRCDVAVDYLPGHVTLFNALHVPVPLHHVRVPGGCSCANKNTLGVDVGYEFELPDAIFAQPDDAKYLVRVRVTLDTCCENSDACGIDYDCDGVRESVRTLQIESPEFTFKMNGDCKERCTGVGVMDTLSFFASVNGSFSNPLPVVSNQTLLPVPGVAPVILNNSALLCCDGIRAALAQDPSRTDYDPQAALEVRIDNQACLTLPPTPPNTCILKNGASALGPCDSVLSTFHCAAIVDCEVSHWNVTVSIQCDANTATLTSTRTIVTDPSNGGLACPALNMVEVVPLTFSQWSSWFDCDPSSQRRLRLRDSLNYGPCHQTQYLNSTVGQWSAWSPCDGAKRYRTRQTNVGCYDALFESQYEPCQVVDCQLMAWSEWEWEAAEPCSFQYGPLPCHIPQVRYRLVLVEPENGGLPCGELYEIRDGLCTNDEGCTYNDHAEVCGPIGPCQSGSCQSTQQCTTAFDNPAYCLNGRATNCSALVSTRAVPCSNECFYSEWSAWSPSSPCVGNNVDGCVRAESRSRSLTGACPVIHAVSCLDTSATRSGVPCTCT